MRAFFLSILFPVLLLGCKDANPAAAREASPADKAGAAADTAEAAKADVTEISIQDADEALQSGAVAVDANSERTRKKNGTVPNAIILTSSYKYDLAQLPQDKSKDLIFYCSNTSCTASDAAAERAHSNGYRNVHIMREGIKGWKDAGKATAPYPKS